MYPHCESKSSMVDNICLLAVFLYLDDILLDTSLLFSVYT